LRETSFSHIKFLKNAEKLDSMNDLSQLLKAASFAAQKHRDQRRKGSAAEPYINHPLEVADLLANVGGIDDIDILIAGLLHDTIEDKTATKEELASLFGERVAGFVLELTDDTSLPKKERKRLQVEHAPKMSAEAKQIKLADKISNITEVANDPPPDWDRNHLLEYIEWGEAVVAGLRSSNPALEHLFDEAAASARRVSG
jgi:guanosine-3',5'-bis(diphosphate) 3'-pyrophosphohydrolase